METTTLPGFVGHVRRLFRAAACSIALAREDGSALTFAAADGAGAAAILGVDLPVGKGIAGWVAMSGQPIAIGEVRADPRFARDVAEATEYVPDAILAAPMVADDGEVLGVIEVLDPGVDLAGDWALDVLGVLAWAAGRLTGPSADAGAMADLGRAVAALVDQHRSGHR